MPKSRRQKENEKELAQTLRLLAATHSKFTRKELTARVLGLLGYIHNTPAAREMWKMQCN